MAPSSPVVHSCVIHLLLQLNFGNCQCLAGMRMCFPMISLDVWSLFMPSHHLILALQSYIYAAESISLCQRLFLIYTWKRKYRHNQSIFQYNPWLPSKIIMINIKSFISSIDFVQAQSNHKMELPHQRK
jgi:hypothetical protein